MNSNDPDDPLPFVQLAAVTRNAIQFLLIKRDQKAADEREDEQRETNERAEAEAQRSKFAVA